MPAEFALIARHFRPLAGAGALDLLDDAAVLDLPPGRRLVIAADAMVEGVHYLPDDPPETVGRKLLRVNLSDMAAMGAVPLGYLMTTAFSRGIADSWIAGFAQGLAEDQDAFGVTVLGGDTAVTPGPTCLSLTILGTVAPDAVLRRVGARAGDDIWVSGTIGDGLLGLRVLRGEVPADAEGHLARRYRLPQPRLALGQAIATVAHAGLDVSDGLVQDLGHLCRAAGCGAEIAAAEVPLSPAARALLARDAALLPALLTGGDDYELLFTAAPDAAAAVRDAAATAGIPVRRIGRMLAGPTEVVARDASGAVLDVARGGWSHF
nr:thiamine-phosphate kinase [Neoroseomonas eburnea]